MQVFAKYVTYGLLLAGGALAGCSTRPAPSKDVSEIILKTMEQAGLKDVTVEQDRAKGVVTLGGRVSSESEKSQAEALARPLALGQVVALEIAVIPVGVEKDAKAINTAIDEGIASNLNAMLISKRLDGLVKHDVKNAVVTLRGDVGSQATRAEAEALAAAVPYVKQVVNTLQVKGQKATTTL